MVWNSLQHRTDSTCLMMFKKERKRCLQIVILHCSVEVSLEMFLNFGQLCGFERYGGTKWAVKITAAFMTFLQKVQG